MSTQGHFTGLTDAINKLNNFQRSIPNIMNSELQDLGHRVVTRARSLAPEKTGRLRRGIRYSVLNGSLYVYAHAYNQRTGYDYAPIQHNNPDYHHTTGEYLFLKKAVDIESRNFMRRVKRRLKPQ